MTNKEIKQLVIKRRKHIMNQMNGIHIVPPGQIAVTEKFLECGEHWWPQAYETPHGQFGIAMVANDDDKGPIVVGFMSEESLPAFTFALELHPDSERAEQYREALRRLPGIKSKKIGHRAMDN